MPPHCDTMDGPVVNASRMALEAGNVNLILPWVPEMGENELKKVFEKTLHVRKLNKEAKELADLWFFETAVRLHRAGEGEPYIGLKPAGLDAGPVVPRAEKAIEHEDAGETIEFLSHTVEEEVKKRFRHAMSLKKYDENDVDAAREYIGAMLEFMLYSHKLYTFMTSAGGHAAEEGGHKH
ncbi:MAG: hypothetical protein IBX40_11125 [Methanosarcinales archaeon]|nr:hypothetical protein [Methanosarcinales archaeon]